MIYLLDTNIISELYKAKPHENLLKWMNDTAASTLYLNAISIGEIKHGIELKRKRHADAVTQLEQMLARIETVYRDKILPFDFAAAQLWGEMMVDFPNHPIDAQIAAIAAAHRAILVTRNVKDFKAWGLQLINPFETI